MAGPKGSHTGSQIWLKMSGDALGLHLGGLVSLAESTRLETTENLFCAILEQSRRGTTAIT